MGEFASIIGAPATLPTVIIAVATAISLILTAVRKKRADSDDGLELPAEAANRRQFGVMGRLYQGWLGYVARFGGESTLTDDERAVLREARDLMR